MTVIFLAWSFQDRLEEMLLIEIPPPEKPQTQAVGITIEKQVVEYGLDDKDVETRRRIVLLMEEAIRADLPGRGPAFCHVSPSRLGYGNFKTLSLFLECSLRLYGSSCTKFGFKDSDVNIDIQFPPHVSNTVALLMSTHVASKIFETSLSFSY